MFLVCRKQKVEERELEEEVCGVMLDVGVLVEFLTVEKKAS